MISIYHESIADIPSLHIVHDSNKNEQLPVVVYFHGFTSAKEHNLPIAYLLAEKGYRVILPDSIHHGERETEISAFKKQIAFWDIVIQNINELKGIYEDLYERKLILEDRFGVAGTSMGGITTAAALTQYSWIKAAAILMGSPKMRTYAGMLVDSFRKAGELPVSEKTITALFDQLDHYDLSQQPEKLNGRPLLFWHGEKDPVVPFDHSYTFYKEVEKQYKSRDKIHFVKEKDRGHKVTRPAILEAVKWFETYL
ncbi:alpha/beta fold hydrolase [Oceanobacillus halotolerans]|uniref:alpha/beta fold hydrolase n=1 Tax=Oceanobacillus halotolerans TaxID=2663380 RepID=UPI0013D9314A|nr:alpha/beta fold hydrolase [Oceanobacillus halotolerans]